jgi:molecular chaperone DnaK
MGASIQGGVLAGDVNDVLLLDVTPLSLGIETMGGVFTKLIDANTTIPTSKSQVFSTAVDNQPSVDIHVLQGERPMASDNRTLGRFQLTDLPPSPRGIPQIEVTFDIDSNGIINVSAKDKATDKVQNIRIDSGNSLSDEEIERMKKEALENEESDNKRKSEIEKLNMVDSTIFQTEKQIKDFDERLTDEDKEKLNESLMDLKNSYENKNMDEIDDKLNTLNETWSTISTRLYQESESSESEKNNSSDEAVDIDDVVYEEVK